jgi:AraC-like DNA-binding protein
MTPKKPEVMADVRFENPRSGEERGFRGDMTIVRSTHGITSVRQTVCVSNDIAVHALEVDVQPGPAWAQVASESHARLSIVLDAIGGGRIESRLKRDQAPANGPFTMNFAPPGAEVWGYSEGIRRVRDIRLDFDLARVSEAVGEKLTMPEPRVFRNDRLRHLARCLAAECEKPDRFSRLYIDTLTLAACIDFLRLGQQGSDRAARRLPPRQLRRVTEYVIEHLSEAVRLRELSAIAGLSPSQFGRVFKASTGLSPHPWQLTARNYQGPGTPAVRLATSLGDRARHRLRGAKPFRPSVQERDWLIAGRMAARAPTTGSVKISVNVQDLLDDMSIDLGQVEERGDHPIRLRRCGRRRQRHQDLRFVVRGGRGDSRRRVGNGIP